MTRRTTGLEGQRGKDPSFWRGDTHGNLSPRAAPSIVGLFGFAASTFTVVATLAGWFGDDLVMPMILSPLAFAFGGLAQFLSAMWSYRVRDELATGVHGAWGSFWIAYGIYQLLTALGVVPAAAASSPAATEFGYWFIMATAITWTGVAAALAENIAVFLVLLTLAAGSTLMAIGLIGGLSIVKIGLSTVERVAAYVLMASAVLAWYTASAIVLEATVPARGATDRQPSRSAGQGHHRLPTRRKQA